MKRNSHPHNPRLYLSLSLGWLLLCPYGLVGGPLKLKPEQAAGYFTDPSYDFEIVP